MNCRTAQNDFVLELSYTFLAGGGSALLLSIAHLHHRLWFLSLFALVPYLWRLKRTCIRCSIALGAIFAFFFSFVVFINDLTVSPMGFCFKLSVLISIFSIFGVAVNGIKKYIGFYPIFIAALWMPLEYFLIRYIGNGGILDFSDVDSSIIIRFGSLFGLLMVSFFVMLVNSIILMLIEYMGRIRFTIAGLRFFRIKSILRLFENIGATKRRNYLPEFRAPPTSSVHLSDESDIVKIL